MSAADGTVSALIMIGMLPAELQLTTIYSAGVTTTAREGEAARALPRLRAWDSSSDTCRSPISASPLETSTLTRPLGLPAASLTFGITCDAA